jgi:DNA-binding transcriptional LysR family regulator
MNLRNIDLNLLVILDAVLAEKSVTRAAKRLGMSASGVSHALDRLRRTFNDPLIERTPHGMVPTQRAQDLGRHVREALKELRHGLAQQLSFDPATSERSFNIRLSDFLTGCLLPRLCARVRAEAPAITLIVGHLEADGEGPQEAGDIQLRVDAAIRGREYRRERIWRDRFIVAMRHGHPAVQREMTLQVYAELPHLDVASAIIDTRPLDEVLDAKGLARRVMITIPSMAAVVAILEHTDLCAVLPERWLTLYSEPGRLAVAPLPLQGIDYNVDMIWHRRDDNDSGHRWLRTVIAQEFATLYAPAAGRQRNGAGGPHKLNRARLAR